MAPALADERVAPVNGNSAYRNVPKPLGGRFGSGACLLLAFRYSSWGRPRAIGNGSWLIAARAVQGLALIFILWKYVV
jgi:hypothetical protein